MNDLVIAAEGLVAAGRTEDARRLFRRALEVDRLNGRAALGLARVLVTMSDLPGALAAAKLAASTSPFDWHLPLLARELGLALSRAGFWEDAEPWLARAATAMPWDHVVASAYSRVRLPSYLAPEIADPISGNTLRRYAAREGSTYIYVIDVVGTCNLRCPTCPVGNSPARPRGFMDLAMFERIIAKIAREAPVPHPQITLFNWGEPLLHPHLPAMIAAVRHAGMRSNLSTNLNIKHGLDAVMEAAPDELKISLSGFSRATYARTHARGDLDLVTKNMRLIRQLADRYKAQTKIWIGHHIYRSNQQHVEPVRRLCAELGFAYHPITAFYMPLERLIEVLDGNPNPLDGGIITDLLVSPVERQRNASVGRSGTFDCELRFNQTVINHDGTVALCCTVYDDSNMLGISFLEEDFDAIERRKYSHPFCQTCMRRNLHYVPQELAPSPPG